MQAAGGHDARIVMRPEPWLAPRLPEGLTPQDFQDAARALLACRPTGRVLPVACRTHSTEHVLVSVENPRHRHVRLELAGRYPPLTHLPPGVAPRIEHGILLPGILWVDGRPADAQGAIPVAVIGPAGYVGSVWCRGSTAWTRIVADQASRGRLLAPPLDLLPPREPGANLVATVWLPPAHEVMILT